MSVLSIRILCSIAVVLATDLPCLQTQIPLAHSDQSISQLNSLTYTHPQAPTVHELSIGGPFVSLALGSTCGGGGGGSAPAIVRLVLASS